MKQLNSTSREQQEQVQISPEWVRLSAAAAIALGLGRGRMYREATCNCVNLLQNYPEGCYANCAYCGLARERPGVPTDNTFIRVGWPLFETERIVQAIAARESSIGRICISQVQDHRAYADLIELERQVRFHTSLPISALVSTTLLDEEKLTQIQAAGADMIGIGLDAASERVFSQTRGRAARSPHRWDQHWEIVELARRLYGPFNVNCHIVVGLGETDRELIELFYYLYQLQVACYLFSFNPEPGTAMQNMPRPPLRRWRRIQLVKHLIEDAGVARDRIEFDELGNLIRLRVDPVLVEQVIDQGVAFMTDGCPNVHGELACNRPYGSYRPGEDFRDYPFKPSLADLSAIRSQLAIGELTA